MSRTRLWSQVVVGTLVAWLGSGPTAAQCTNDDHGNSQTTATVLDASTFQTIPPTL